jgi:hypothetical protein
MIHDLPLHIQELIVDKLDNKNKAVCKLINIHFNKHIGDISPKHIKHQVMFLNVVKSLVESTKFAFFNVAVNSSNFRMIISDENGVEVYVYIIKKGIGGKTITRNYKKDKCVVNFRDLFRKKTLYGTLGITSSQLFEDVFTNLRSVSCVSGRTTPSCFLDWKSCVQTTNNQMR